MPAGRSIARSATSAAPAWPPRCRLPPRTRRARSRPDPGGYPRGLVALIRKEDAPYWRRNLHAPGLAVLGRAEELYLVCDALEQLRVLRVAILKAAVGVRSSMLRLDERVGHRPQEIDE